MARVELKDLLEAGVHFGHQTRRWNPKMRRFIFGERDGNYIIDLLTTQRLLDQAQAFAADIARRGGTDPVRRDQEAGAGRDSQRRGAHPGCPT